MRYEKPALTLVQQLDLLQSRGLVIPDRPRALRWLRYVSYYRLSAYLLPFKDGKKFRDGVDFDRVAALYAFDRELRLILLEALERIEVALRACLTYDLSHAYGPFGYADPKNFDPKFDHAALLEELHVAKRDSQETFVAHFQGKYHHEAHLPIWMASELLSFGQLSRLYKASNPAIKKKFAALIGVSDAIVSSWLHTLNYVRNVCAHHSRLWNRELALKPTLPHKAAHWPYRVESNERLYCVLVMLQHILSRIDPDCRWRDRLVGLFDANPEVPLAAMHVPSNWREEPLWGSLCAKLDGEVMLPAPNHDENISAETVQGSVH